MEPLPEGQIDLGQAVPTQKWGEKIKPSKGLHQLGSLIVPIASKVQSPNFQSGTTGWQLSSSGSSEVIDGTVDLSGATGTLTVNHGGTGATTLTGILKGNGTSAFTTITPLAGTKQYYVADSSGGPVTRRLTFTDGILTSES